MCRSRDPELINSNMTICLQATTKMVRCLDELRKYKCLDAPWVNCTAYLAAMLTTLFVYSHRKDEITSSEMAKLKGEMDMWCMIMDECGTILGKRQNSGCGPVKLTRVQGLESGSRKPADRSSIIRSRTSTIILPRRRRLQLQQLQPTC